MKTLVAILALSLTACASMTPTQQKWLGVAAGLVVVGAIAAERADSEESADPITQPTSRDLPCYPQPDGSCR